MPEYSALLTVFSKLFPAFVGQATVVFTMMHVFCYVGMYVLSHPAHCDARCHGMSTPHGLAQSPSILARQTTTTTHRYSFGGRITPNDPMWEKRDFALNLYYLLNFNTYKEGMVTLFMVRTYIV